MTTMRKGFFAASVLASMAAPASADIRTEVGACWNVGSLSDLSMQTSLTLRFRMDESGGRPDPSSVVVIEVASPAPIFDETGQWSKTVEQAFQAARRAIMRCGGSITLPSGEFGQITFDPEAMRLR